MVPSMTMLDRDLGVGWDPSKRGGVTSIVVFLESDVILLKE